MKKKRLLRITTVPLSLVTLLKGQPQFFEKNNFEVLTVSAAGKEVQQLIDAGVKHKSIWLTRKITPFRDVIAIIQLIRIISTFKPTIIHTHTPKAGIIGMLAAIICRLPCLPAGKAGVPVRLHTIAGLPWIEEKGIGLWILKRVEILTYRCAHRVYPNSNNLLDFLHRELNFDLSKTKVIGRGSSNGIDAGYFKRDDVLMSYAAGIRQQYNIPPHDIVFSFVGRVVKDKGIVELVNAFLEIRKNYSAWLLVVGDFEPELDPVPYSTLEALKLDEHIVMAGFQQDVRPWLLASDIFVFPSHREGFPNGVMQACCMELPVIAADINGCNEIIENGISGLLIPVNDEQALVDAMSSLANDMGLRIEMGRKGREFVAENFSQQFVWGELLKEYEAMVGKII